MFENTTPKTLAEAAIANLGKEVIYPTICLDEAQKAVELILKTSPLKKTGTQPLSKTAKFINENVNNFYK
ncbi:MAG: hypothetical protein ACFFC7_10165 [Candidatus Hermodarchaeota archaeon]